MHQKQRLFGIPGAWGRVRRLLCTFPYYRIQPCRACRGVRDDKYATDHRWAKMAKDADYMKMYPRKRGWWPEHIWTRTQNEEVEMGSFRIRRDQPRQN